MFQIINLAFIFFALLTTVTWGASLSPLGGDCAVLETGLTARNSGAYGVTVDGPLSMSATSSCSLYWEAHRTVTLPAGRYVMGHVLDYTFTVDFSNVPDDDLVELQVELQSDVVGAGPNIGSRSRYLHSETGFLDYSVNTGVFPVFWDMPGGEYVVRQKGVIRVISKTDVPFLAIGTFHFPMTSAPSPYQAAPEPGVALMTGSGLLGLGLWRRGHKRAST